MSIGLFRRLRRMWRTWALALLGAVLLTGGPVMAAPDKEWTVLIFMNGKNDLEPFALEDFDELAQVGSSDKVNFVVQMGRPGARPDDLEVLADVYGGWSGARRFYVTKGQTPDPGQEIEILPGGAEVDMGSPEVLRDFLKWGKAKYPAKRYAVVIWNHGQGYRLMFRAGEKALLKSDPKPAREGDPTNSHRAVSQDSDTGHIIYNSDLKDAIGGEFGGDLKLIGFDACLMAMIETAYELKSLAPVMVASEELEPGRGWNYTTVAQTLTAAPASDETAFAKILVDSYRTNYGNSDSTTLSAVRLGGVQTLALELSRLSDQLLAGRTELFPLVKAARAKRSAYNPTSNPVSIDLIGFLNALEAQLEAKAPASAALAQTRKTRDLARQAVLENYASSLRAEPFGSYGLAIYFPASKAIFDRDAWGEGYLRSNEYKKIAFVAAERWSAFLAAYLDLPN